MHGVPAFRAFGAPGRGTPLSYPPAYARTADRGPIPGPPCAGPRVRPGPFSESKSSPSTAVRRCPTLERGFRSPDSLSLTPLSRQLLRTAAPPGGWTSPGSFRSLMRFDSPQCQALRGHQAVLRNPAPPGTSSAHSSVPFGLGMGPATRVRVSNSLRLELPAPPLRERHARRATPGQASELETPATFRPRTSATSSRSAVCAS